MSSSEATPDLVVTVEKLLQTLTANPSVKGLGAIASENAKLREENESAFKTNRRLNADLTVADRKLAAKDGELKTALEEKKALASKLAKAENELGTTRTKMRDLEDSYKQQQKEDREELEEKRDELQRLQQFSLPVELVDDETEQKIVSKLDSIFSFARRLADDFVGADLPHDLLQSKSIWDGIHSHNGNSGGIPLPQSNTQVAKQMRVALFLSVVGHELCDGIFQSTYLFKDASELGDLLKLFASKDPDMEAYMRSVFLMGSRRIKSTDGAVDDGVCNRLLAVLRPAIPGEKQKTFAAELQHLCKMALKEWQFIQTLEYLVRPELGLDLQSKRKVGWKPLVFLGATPPPAPPSAAKPRTNGTAPASAQTKHSSVAAVTTSNYPATTVDITNGIPVWPAFYNLSYKDETVKEGFVLPLSLKTAAEAEEQEQSASPTSGTSSSHIHRSSRAGRRQSMPSGNGQADQAKQKVSFLSNGVGGGPKGA